MKTMMEVTPLQIGELTEQLYMLKLKESALIDTDKEIEDHSSLRGTRLRDAFQCGRSCVL